MPASRGQRLLLSCRTSRGLLTAVLLAGRAEAEGLNHRDRAATRLLVERAVSWVQTDEACATGW